MTISPEMLTDLAVMSTREASRKYNQTEGSIRRIRSQWGISTTAPKVQTLTTAALTLPQFILTSDWHIPYHLLDAVQRVVVAARKYNVTNLVVVGDFVDFPTLSRFDPRDIDSTVGMELSAAGDVLYELVEAGLTIHWVRGNHELRFFRAMKHQVDIQDLIKMCGAEDLPVHGYNDETVLVMSGKRTWYLTHPQEYSRIPLSTARKIHEKIGSGVSVATAHNHLWGVGMAPNGQDYLVEIGGLFDVGKMAYLNRGGATTYPYQQTGLWVIQDGEVRMP